MELLTTQQAAERLGVSEGRVRALILAGRLPAEKFGKAHMIREENLKLVEERKPGRPRKTPVSRNQLGDMVEYAHNEPAAKIKGKRPAARKSRGSG